MPNYPKLKDRPRSEAEITKEIRYYMREANIWHWKNWAGPMSVAGISDILGIYKGRFLAVEVKRPGQHPTKKQLNFLERVHREGGLAVCVHSWEELAKFFETVEEKP